MTQATSGSSTHLSVFEHEKRREWGLAVLAWETSDKRGYVFENGQLRILVQPFYPLMREVERPIDEIQALHETLEPELKAARADLGVTAHRGRSDSSAPVSFDDQLNRFHAAFPNGFEDAIWLDKQRGATARRRLGAHRDPAIAEAQELLGAAVLESQVAGQKYPAIRESLVTVLRHTDLVPAAEINVLRDADPGLQRALSLMFVELLHGEGELGARLGHFVAAFEKTLGKPAGWQLATALPALLDPAGAIVVRPTIFRTLAKWMAPGTSLPKSPTAVGYRRCLAMAQHLQIRLARQGEKPRDLLDVYDFIRVTVRPGPKQAVSK